MLDERTSVDINQNSGRIRLWMLQLPLAPIMIIPPLKCICGPDVNHWAFTERWVWLMWFLSTASLWPAQLLCSHATLPASGSRWHQKTQNKLGGSFAQQPDSAFSTAMVLHIEHIQTPNEVLLQIFDLAGLTIRACCAHFSNSFHFFKCGAVLEEPCPWSNKMPFNQCPFWHTHACAHVCHILPHALFDSVKGVKKVLLHMLARSVTSMSDKCACVGG